MDFISIVGEQILSPPILFFLLGMFAALAGSDLKIPGDMSAAMMLFMLTSIGLKGGVGIAKVDIGSVLAPAIISVFLGITMALVSFAILRKLKFDAANAGSIAGHYAAVGAVTMVVGFSYLDRLNVYYEPFMPAMYPLMDSPAIITAILVARVALAKTEGIHGEKILLLKLLKNSILGKAVLLLVAAMAIGYLSGEKGTSKVMPFFDGMFMGVLCLFMLEMGLLAAGRLHDWKVVGYKLAMYAFIMPIIHGIIGVTLGTLAGLSIGGAAMLGVLAGSASHISAPAAMRAGIPEANPSLSLTASVALTLPMNVTIGVPLFYAVAQMLAQNLQ